MTTDLSDSEEVSLGSDLLLADSDGDGLRDGTEIAVDLDPISTDSDEDGVSDPQFIVSASEPAVQLQPTGSPHKIQFTALPHVSYDVLFSEDLKDWDILEQIDAGSQPVVLTVNEPLPPVSGRPKGFFSLKPR